MLRDMAMLSSRDRALIAATLRKAATRFETLARKPNWSRAKGSESRSLERFETDLYIKVSKLLRQWADQAGK